MEASASPFAPVLKGKAGVAWAAGAAVNRLLNQFQQMKKMLKQLARGKQKGIPPGLKGLMR